MLKISNLKYSILSLVCISLLLGLSSCVYFNTFYNAKRYYKEGVKENEDNTTGRPKTANYQKSIDSAARVVEYYRDSKYVDDALLLMGKSYYGIQNYPKAKRKFEELLTNYPDSPLTFEARLHLGKTMIAMRRPDQGINLLNDLWVDEKAPHEVRLESRKTQADYYFEKENYYQALSEYGKLLQIAENKSERANIQYQIGECHFELEEFQNAEEAYLLVLKEKPGRLRRFEATYKRALTLQKQGDLEGALAICEKLLKKDIYFSYYDRVNLAKAGILNELERVDEAVELYQRIIELYPRTETSAEASYRLGQIYLHHFEDFEKSEEYLGKVRTEMGQSEFAEESQLLVDDLRYLRTLITEIDSVQADIDTLTYRLEWIAENPQGIPTDSTLTDTLETAIPDSAGLTEVIPVSADSLSMLGKPSLPGIPPGKSGRGVEQQPGYVPPHQPGFPEMPGRPGYQPGMQTPRLAAQQTLVLPTDSAAVYERINADREALASSRYRLAEHLWSRFDNPDSARIILSKLAVQADYPDLRARSLLSLYYLDVSESSDSTGSDSILYVIHQEFPESEYDRWVRPLLGLDPLPEPVDSVAELFQAAEQLWLEEEAPEVAIERYAQVIETWPDSEWAPKALYAVAWVQENILNDVTAALASYDSLIARYPNSEYVAVAQKKTAPPPPEVPDSVAIGEDTTEVALLTSGFGPVPPGSGPPQIIGGERALQDAIDENRLYPPVALEAEISGEVIVQFTVDTEGIPGNFQIMREEPGGFDFGEMAIQALQSVNFKPGYTAGEYIESTATQLVRFTP